MPKRKIVFQPAEEGLKLQSAHYWRNSEHYDSIAEIINSNNENLPITPKLESIPNIDNRAVFLIRNCLTPSECEQIISASEKTGFEFRSFEGNNKDSASAVALSESLSQTIFSRIRHLAPPRSYFDAGLGIVLDDIDFDNQIVKYYGDLVGINPSIRVERYNEGQRLKMHRDGLVLVKDQVHTYTIFAILIYLNGGYEGGATKFAVSKIPKKEGELYDCIDLKGGIGDALVFRHEILHCGAPIVSSVKYVMRLDFAYKLIII